MKKETIGKYIVEGFTIEEENLYLEHKKSLNEYSKITEHIELLKDMERIDSNAAIQKVKSKIDKKQHTNWKNNLLKVAAILILPLLSMVLWQKTQIKKFQSEITQNEISTVATLRAQTTLPDGTKVWLNGNSSIKYPSVFEGTERRIELTGEAYFEVAQNKMQPFKVDIGNIIVEATGTEFNITSYQNETTQEILLTEGSVNLLMDSEDEELLITALKVNELAQFNTTNRKMHVKVVAPEKYTAWKTGKIIFQNDPIKEVTKKLERWYNVDFDYPVDFMEEHAFTGTFIGEDINQILKCIEITTPIHFELEEPKVNSKNEYQKTRILIKMKQ